MNTLRSFIAPTIRAITVVVVGACLLGGFTAFVHKSPTPYYAQLAANATKVGAPQKNTGDPHGFAYTGNDAQ